MKDEFDAIILGSGPAGLQSAIHGAGRKVSVLVLDRLQKSSEYFNMRCFPQHRRRGQRHVSLGKTFFPRP